jgi:hypothetical protein
VVRAGGDVAAVVPGGGAATVLAENRNINISLNIHLKITAFSRLKYVVFTDTPYKSILEHKLERYLKQLFCIYTYLGDSTQKRYPMHI